MAKRRAVDDDDLVKDGFEDLPLSKQRALARGVPASAAPPREASLQPTGPAGPAGQAGQARQARGQQARQARGQQAGQAGQVGRAGQAGLLPRPVAPVPATGGLAATRKALVAAAAASELEKERAGAGAAAARSICFNSVDAQAQDVVIANAAHAARQRRVTYAVQYAQHGVAGAAASSGGHGGRGGRAGGSLCGDDDEILLAASQAFEAGQGTGGVRNDADTVGTAASGNATSSTSVGGGRASGSLSDDDDVRAQEAKAQRARAARAARAARKATDAAAEVDGTCLPRRTLEVQDLLVQERLIRAGQVYPSVASLEMAAREVANATGNAFFCHIDSATASFGTLGGDIWQQHSRSAEAKHRRTVSNTELGTGALGKGDMASSDEEENEENELHGQNEMGVTAGDDKLGCDNGGTHMRIIAKRTAPGAPTWKVTEFTQPSVGVTSRFKASGILECAYTSETLGALLRDYVALADEDGLSARAIKAVLKEWLNEDTTERPDEWASRICICAVHQRFGKPADNIGRLPALAESLRKEGHVVNIAWCDGERVVRSLMAVLEAEHDRSFNSAQQVARDRFDGDVTRLDKRKFPITAQWGPGNEADVRAEWANLIKTATSPGRQYLESLFWAPARAVKNAHAMLRFVGADACHLSDKGDAYTLFSLLGLTSNNNTVVWAYAWLNTNERTESWQAVLQFVKTNYPSMVGKDARFVMVADGDKGLRAAWRLELEEAGVGFFLCAKHRAATMTGKGSQSLYSALVQSPTQALLESTLHSGEPSLQAAVAAFPHEEQFISARVRDGRYSTFGRSTTQFVEGGSHMQAGSLANY